LPGNKGKIAMKKSILIAFIALTMALPLPASVSAEPIDQGNDKAQKEWMKQERKYAKEQNKQQQKCQKDYEKYQREQFKNGQKSEKAEQKHWKEMEKGKY
jgi:hypothetical protein